LNLRIGWLNLDLVGWIMIAAGLLGLIVAVWIWGGRRPETIVERPPGYRRVEEREDHSPPEPL
jgi:hypothetical protein